MSTLTVSFKTPDALDDALEGLEEGSLEREKAEAVAEIFIKYGEYVTIEIDVEASTARVVRA